MALLQVQGLTKWFGGLTACDRVSAEIQEGEIVGLIGPNGAGKRTPFDGAGQGPAPRRVQDKP